MTENRINLPKCNFVKKKITMNETVECWYKRDFINHTSFDVYFKTNEKKNNDKVDTLFISFFVYVEM